MNAAHAEIASVHEQPASIRPYIAVWITLLVLTGVTVTGARLNLGTVTIIVVLTIAAIKSVLVLLYFMHLRHEKRLLLKLLIPGTLVLLAIFIGLTYADVITRQ
ncbi:MAG: cytochrome C oxidase subunit IV family protein [Chitinivibrionales bacterium]|nr:cytochrome C oxidase subunit IV family protein [Chitinivibrionales bacterium]